MVTHVTVPDTSRHPPTGGSQLPVDDIKPQGSKLPPEPTKSGYGKAGNIPADEVGGFVDQGEIVRRPSGTRQGPPKIEFIIPEELSQLLLRDFTGTRPVRTQYPVWRPQPKLDKFVADICPGADVLIRGCTPQRHIAPSYEWSTEPVPPTHVLALAGGLLVVVVAWEAIAAYGAASTTLEWVGAVAAAF